jgi:hypothetical protein
VGFTWPYLGFKQCRRSTKPRVFLFNTTALCFSYGCVKYKMRRGLCKIHVFYNKLHVKYCTVLHWRATTCIVSCRPRDATVKQFQLGGSALVKYFNLLKCAGDIHNSSTRFMFYQAPCCTSRTRENTATGPNPSLMRSVLCQCHHFGCYRHAILAAWR